MLSSARWQRGFLISPGSLTITNLSQPGKISMKEYLQGKRLTNTEKQGWTRCRTQGKKSQKVEKAEFWYRANAKNKFIQKLNHLDLKQEVTWKFLEKTPKFLVKNEIIEYPTMTSRTRYFKRAWVWAMITCCMKTEKNYVYFKDGTF